MIITRAVLSVAALAATAKESFASSGISAYQRALLGPRTTTDRRACPPTSSSRTRDA
ncbi:MAG: hypothetical protein M5U28_24875 [Sandaracinaceae bacterium]|nr:hypothetical protein [Sandaracinaceae bacterium]